MPLEYVHGVVVVYVQKHYCSTESQICKRDKVREQICGQLYAYCKEELGLLKGDAIEVLSKEEKISGNEGWWTGKCNGKVGIFLFVPLRLNFSSLSKDKLQFDPPHKISWNDLKLKEVIGAGGFGKVYRGLYRNLEVAVKAASEKGAW